MSGKRIFSRPPSGDCGLNARGGQAPPGPPAGTAPPLDALGFRDHSRRFSRSARVLDGLSDALAGPPAGGPLAPAKAREVAAHLSAARETCAALQDALDRVCLVAPPPRPLSPPGSPRRSPPPRHPQPFDPGRDFGYVASVRGLLEYSVRHLPRLLTDAPASGGDMAALWGGLGGLVTAAQRLAVALNERRGTATSRARGGCRIGRAYEGTAYGVSVEHAPGGPDARRGTYGVVYDLATTTTVTVRSGRTYDLPAGTVVYIGSALNSGGVWARVSWHLDPGKPAFKNVDFLKPFARPVAIWWTHDEDKQECPWSAVLAASTEYHCPAPMFGATDCKICTTHLYHTAGPPSVYDFARRLGRLVPGHAALYHQTLAATGEVGAVINSSQVAAKPAGSLRPSPSRVPPRPASAPEAERPCP